MHPFITLVRDERINSGWKDEKEYVNEEKADLYLHWSYCIVRGKFGRGEEQERIIDGHVGLSGSWRLAGRHGLHALPAAEQGIG